VLYLYRKGSGLSGLTLNLMSQSAENFAEYNILGAFGLGIHQICQQNI